MVCLVSPACQCNQMHHAMLAAHFRATDQRVSIITLSLFYTVHSVNSRVPVYPTQLLDTRFNVLRA